MANLQYCPDITPDNGLTNQPTLVANGAAVAGGLTPVDSSTIAITVTSPASPAAGECFAVADATANAEANNITVDFGTDNFNGSTGAFIINCDGGGGQFCFIDAATGWVKLS